jgi:hypothetical protein
MNHLVGMVIVHGHLEIQDKKDNIRRYKKKIAPPKFGCKFPAALFNQVHEKVDGHELCQACA